MGDELWAIAIAMIDPDLLAGLNEDLITNETLKKVLVHIKKSYKGEKQIPLDSLGLVLPKGDSDNSFNYYNAIQKAYEDFLKIDRTNRQRRFQSCISTIKKHQRKDELLTVIREGYQKIEQGLFDEGIELLKNLKYTAAPELRTAMSLLSSMSFLFDNGFKTGIPYIDSEGGLLKGQLMTIGGISGHQKTMFSLWLMIQILIKNPEFTALYFEKEMLQSDIIRRLVSHAINVDGKNLIMASSDYQYRENNMAIWQEKIRSLQENKPRLKDVMDRLYIVPMTGFKDATDMWRYIDTYGAHLWCLDFATMLQPKSGRTDEDSMKREFEVMKGILDSTNSFGIVLSQIKQSANVQTRNVQIPTENDLEWAKHLVYFSSYIMVLFNAAKTVPSLPKEYFYVVPKKVRHGKLPIMPFIANPSVCQYTIPDKIEHDNMLSYYKVYCGIDGKQNNNPEKNKSVEFQRR